MQSESILNDVTLLLRSALNPDDYKGFKNSPIELGKSRYMQYLQGISRFFKDLKVPDDCNVLLVDNTVSNSKQNILQFKKLVPHYVQIVLTETNRFGRFNKGAGDVETIQYLSKNKYLRSKWIFWFELRLQLLDIELINSFLNVPSSIVYLDSKNNSATSGYFGCETCDLVEFTNQISLHEMVNNNISIESLLYQFAKKRSWNQLEKNGFTLRFDSKFGPHLY